MKKLLGIVVLGLLFCSKAQSLQVNYALYIEKKLSFYGQTVYFTKNFNLANEYWYVVGVCKNTSNLKINTLDVHTINITGDYI